MLSFICAALIFLQNWILIQNDQNVSIYYFIKDAKATGAKNYCIKIDNQNPYAINLRLNISLKNDDQVLSKLLRINLDAYSRHSQFVFSVQNANNHPLEIDQINVKKVNSD